MKNAAITLRLSAELVKHLGRIAVGRGVPKSQVVRDAVTKYLSPPVSESPAPLMTARDLASRWKDLPRLTADEAYEFRKDADTARIELPALAATYLPLGAKSRPSNNATTP